MHIRGVIIEGYSNAGKTSVLKALKQYQSQDETAERSVLILGEHYSQILNNIQGKYLSLNREEHIKLLKERVDMLLQLNNWARYLGLASRRSRGLFFVLERFHLNHRAAFPNSVSEELIEIEEQLVTLGAKCVLLTISPTVAETRIKSRNPKEWTYKTDGDVKSSINELLQTQDMLRQQSNLSRIPTIEINTDNMDWNEYARAIMEATDFA